MSTPQNEIFSASEGDRWFIRNKDDLNRFDPDTDTPLRLIEDYGLHPASVLEVGAANGVRLAAISERYGARVVAVDPSAEAIADGKRMFPCVEFSRGVADHVPLEAQFELIIVNFVFHWIDRAKLLRSAAEVDRLVVNGGFLIIGDFYPSNLTRVRYHHLPKQEVYTYKQNYAEIFLASGLYHPVGLLTGKAGTKSVTGYTDEENRVGVWLLRKMLDDHYVEGSFQG